MGSASEREAPKEQARPGIDKARAVLRMLSGESAAVVAREHAVPVATLEQWRRDFARAAEGAFGESEGPRSAEDLRVGGLFRADSARRFLERLWPDAPHVEHGPLDRLALPPGLFDLERVLAAPEVRASLFGPEGFRAAAASNTDALAFYKGGTTLYLIGLERAFPSLRAICRAIGRDLDVEPAHIYVEGFASPRAGTGSSLHYDFDVNFNVQLKGEKDWRYAPNTHVESPLQSLVVKRSQPPSHPFDGSLLPTKMPRGARKARMKPGSVIFVPRAYWHDTVVRSESFAISFVIKPPPLLQLFARELTNQLTTQAAWRAFPVGKDRVSRLERAMATLPDLLKSIRPEEVLFNLIRVRWPEGSERRFEERRRRRGTDRWLLSVEHGDTELELPIADVLAPLVRWIAAQEDVFTTEMAVSACPGTSPRLAREVIGYLLRAEVLVRAGLDREQERTDLDTPSQ